MSTPEPAHVEPEPDGRTIPEGVTWGAALPHVVAILNRLQSEIDALSQPDQPEETP